MTYRVEVSRSLDGPTAVEYQGTCKEEAEAKSLAAIHEAQQVTLKIWDTKAGKPNAAGRVRGEWRTVIFFKRYR